MMKLCFPQDLEFAYKASLERVEYLEETILRVLHKRVEVEISLDRSKNGNEEETRKRELESDVKVNRLLDRVQGKIVSIEKIS